MDLFFKITLFVHILAGSIGLFCGTINIIRKKGDQPHRLVGKFFVIGMLINAVAGFIMSILHSNLFLLIIAVFSFYMTATGQRILRLKSIAKGQQPKKVDWIISITMVVFAIFFIVYGSTMLINSNNFGTVLIVFGLISILMTYADFRIYSGILKYKNYWLLVHIQRMIGAYIAALTAFLVVNNTYLPPVVAWLLPTIVFVPLIFYWSRKNAQKRN